MDDDENVLNNGFSGSTTASAVILLKCCGQCQPRQSLVLFVAYLTALFMAPPTLLQLIALGNGHVSALLNRESAQEIRSQDRCIEYEGTSV